MKDVASQTRAAVEQAELSLEALFRECASDVYAYVASLLRDHAISEDVTSQAFERAFHRRRSRTTATSHSAPIRARA
jgi:DNA-directed RNA polymerase specialized sigma24 family protein